MTKRATAAEKNSARSELEQRPPVIICGPGFDDLRSGNLAIVDAFVTPD